MPPAPCPPPPPPRHPDLWRDSDGYTRKEVDEADERTLERAKKYVDESVVEHLEDAAAEVIAATQKSADEAAASASDAAAKVGDAAAAAAEAEAAADRAASEAASAVAGARRIVESPDGRKSITVPNEGSAIFTGDGVRIVFRLNGDSEETILFRYGNTNWYLLPGAVPPADESDMQTFPAPCAEYGASSYQNLYVRTNGVVQECQLATNFNNDSYLIRRNGSKVGVWRFDGYDQTRVVTFADLRRIALGCNDASVLLATLRKLPD